MGEHRRNYYGSLCTEMYEMLHKQAPEDELNFYLSFAQKGDKILEPLCGSGRFFVPFLERGFSIRGMDLSGEMLEKLREKVPHGQVEQADIMEYCPDEKFDYIFVSSGSISLFTDMQLCRRVLGHLKDLLASGGKLVFAVETMADRCPDDSDYIVTASVRTEEGFDLVLKTKHFYDEKTQTQFSPGIYELYDGSRLLQVERMDFQTHLYRFGEMEQYLREIGFTAIKTYSSFEKDIAAGDGCEMFLFECGVDKACSGR